VGGETASNSESPTEGSETAAASTEGTSKEADSTSKNDATSKGADSGKRCTSVPVSTNNAVQVVKKNGEKFRVTPFNFMMSERQLVSPEYDKLERLEDIRGAKVREFSTWKTVGTIVGVTAVTVGTFIGIGIASPESGFGE
jgi:hypothetical protein